MSTGYRHTCVFDLTSHQDTSTYVHMYACTYACMYINVCVYVYCMYVCTCGYPKVNKIHQCALLLAMLHTPQRGTMHHVHTYVVLCGIV